MTETLESLEATRFDDIERLARIRVERLDELDKDELVCALAVFLLHPRNRIVLEAIDPQAVKQARAALLLTNGGTA